MASKVRGHQRSMLAHPHLGVSPQVVHCLPTHTRHTQAATLGDPRRPQEVRKVSVPAAIPDEVTSSYILMMALTCGVSGLMFQSKLLVWAALFTAMAGYTHMPFDAPDAARMMMLVFTMAAWSFVQVYFKPLLGMAPRAAHSTPPPPNALHDD